MTANRRPNPAAMANPSGPGNLLERSIVRQFITDIEAQGLHITGHGPELLAHVKGRHRAIVESFHGRDGLGTGTKTRTD